MALKKLALVLCQSTIRTGLPALFFIFVRVVFTNLGLVSITSKFVTLPEPVLKKVRAVLSVVNKKELSYSYIPISKIARTRKLFILGTEPKAVILAVGATRVNLSPHNWLFGLRAPSPCRRPFPGAGGRGVVAP